MKGRRYEPGHPVSTRKGIQNQDGRLCLFWRVLKTFRVHAYGYIIKKEKKAPESFDEFDNMKTEHKCPKCGYEW